MDRKGTRTYEVTKDTETGCWQLREDGQVVGVWERKADAKASYRVHAILFATGHGPTR